MMFIEKAVVNYEGELHVTIDEQGMTVVYPAEKTTLWFSRDSFAALVSLAKFQWGEELT